MAHVHAHNAPASGKRLLAVILFNVIITAAEVIGGLITGYLALLADAVHNLSDVAALILAYIGQIGESRPSTKRSTYGYKRLEVMTATVSAVSLVVIAVFIFVEAWERFVRPQDITNPTLLIIVTSIGLLGNLLSVLFLFATRHHSLNFKTAFLHMLYDTLSSVAVLVGAIVIINTGLTYIDPLLSVLIAVMILWSSLDVLKEATMIFMEAVPRRIDFDKVARAIAAHPGICEVHHLHIWSLSSTQVALSCHIVLNKEDYLSAPRFIVELAEIMARDFNIGHCTIQPETGHCPDQLVNLHNDREGGNL